MPEPTVEQVINIDKKLVAKPSALGPIVAFFLLPPLGVYLLWKEKSFHRIFAVLTVLLGFLNLISAVPVAFLGQGSNLIFIIITISLLQVSGSFYFYRKAKKRGYLEETELTVLGLTVLLVDFVVIPLLFGFLFFQTIQPYLEQLLDPYKDFQGQIPPNI